MRTLWFALGLAVALSPLLTLTDCTTHWLGGADIASLQDSQQLEARIYKDLDGGRDRAFARALYCSDRAVLARSGAAGDAGPIQCEAPK